MRPEDNPPRKVTVGTVMQPFADVPTDLDQRLPMLADLIERMAERAATDHPDTGLDLAVLPEAAVTIGRNGSAAEKAVPLEGPVLDTFAPLARRHATCIVVPLVLEEDRTEDIYSNAAALIDRAGDVMGIYRKVHPVAHIDTTVLENGVTPGAEFPVFDCHFGRLGIQICWDMSYADGFTTLARKGAEIVVWPSASPQTVVPACRALRNRLYIVSSTFKKNASVFEPTGMVAAQVREPGEPLVHRLDLSYIILHWCDELKNGRAFDEAYGARAGYHYSETEDTGLFWSNDPDMTIGEMTRELGIMSFAEHVERDRKLQDEARGGPPH